MDQLILSLLNGTTEGSVLFIVSAGLTLTFGVMRILNLAHGALYMVGAYVGWTIAVRWGWGFTLAVVGGGAAAMGLGILMDQALLRRLRGSFNEQAMLTYGIVLILTNLALWIWGPDAKAAFSPSLLSGTVTFAGISFPTARFGLIVTAAAIALGMWLIDRRTLLGARIRAGRDDREMLESLGVNFGRLTLALFAFGALLAGVGGVLGGQVSGANLGQGSSVLLLAIAVVVIGGLGSVPGALLGALLLGVTQAICVSYLPSVASFSPYLLMVAVLVLRPAGLVPAPA